jgi:hypothetical protein
MMAIVNIQLRHQKSERFLIFWRVKTDSNESLVFHSRVLSIDDQLKQLGFRLSLSIDATDYFKMDPFNGGGTGQSKVQTGT